MMLGASTGAIHQFAMKARDPWDCASLPIGIMPTYLYWEGLSIAALPGALLERVDQLLRCEGRSGILEECQQVRDIFRTQLHTIRSLCHVRGVLLMIGRICPDGPIPLSRHNRPSIADVMVFAYHQHGNIALPAIRKV